MCIDCDKENYNKRVQQASALHPVIAATFEAAGYGSSNHQKEAKRCIYCGYWVLVGKKHFRCPNCTTSLS